MFKRGPSQIRDNSAFMMFNLHKPKMIDESAPRAAFAVRAHPSLSLEREKAFCIETARKAANICLRAPKLKAFTKQDLSPVSAADMAVQATVLKTLREAFPEDVLTAEEEPDDFLADGTFRSAVENLAGMNIAEIVQYTEKRARPGYRCWTLDPIDGTKGFLSGKGYAVGLALLDSGASNIGNPLLGALTLPFEGVTLLGNVAESHLEEIALDGLSGAALNYGEPFHSLAANPIDVTIARGPWLLSGIDDLVLSNRPPWTFLCCGSLIKYAAVARRYAVALVQVLKGGTAHVWDHGAGIAVVLASGGMVSDEHGRPVMAGCGLNRRELRIHDGARAIVATARGVNHEEVCSEVRNTMCISFPT